MKDRSFISSCKMTNLAPAAQGYLFPFPWFPSREPVCLFPHCLFGLPLVPSSPIPIRSDDYNLPKPRSAQFPCTWAIPAVCFCGADPSAEALFAWTPPGGFVWASEYPPLKTLEIFVLENIQVQLCQEKSKRHTSLSRVNVLCKSVIWDSHARGQMKQQLLGLVRWCRGQFPWDNAKENEWGDRAELSVATSTL